VIAHESDRGRVPGQTTGVGHEERFCIAGLDIVALHVPGHTLGALTYLCDGAAFTGDTLFIGGCGRLFEGTPAMMHESLCRKLARLDHATIVYCGHEYTVQNLRFAQTIEPENPHVREKLAAAQAARARGERTVSTIGDELRTNPFMRVGEAALARFGADPVSVLAAVRRAKDNFSG
jgi:hydroxyacylglutathione hydrolase